MLPLPRDLLWIVVAEHTYPCVRLSCSLRGCRMMICSGVRRCLPEVPGRTNGCAFRSIEGGEASGGAVLQRRILLPMELLLAAIVFGRALRRTGRAACDHLSLID